MADVGPKRRSIGTLALQSATGPARRRGGDVSKTTRARVSGNPAAQMSPARRVQKVLSERVDLDLAQISSRALLPPSRVLQVLDMMKKKGVVQEVGFDGGKTSRYKLAKVRDRKQ